MSSVALLRGINLGKINKVDMKSLKHSLKNWAFIMYVHIFKQETLFLITVNVAREN
ncbi:DUF1697 domain-containing protein [Psychrobacillus sp. Sa2BUA9]|uniref:DUF1697 domain-containing protein n=1 Tax=Psychrobacillus faecigallinarum TaxID=2762235 RepID=A0ABR8RAJ3_9BACI|nr:DUF1697 domain-containing protein [Psychrobacillus faecigallinarum]